MDKTNKYGIKAQLKSVLPDYILAFSESQSRFIISISPVNKDPFEKHFHKNNIPFTQIGKVGGDSFSLNDFIDVSLDQLEDIYYSTISRLMTQ